MDLKGNLHYAEQAELNTMVVRLASLIEMLRPRATNTKARKNLRAALKAYDALLVLSGDDTDSAEAAEAEAPPEC